MVALLPVGNGDAAEPEARFQQAGDALLDGSAAMTGLLVLSFPVALSGRRRKARMTRILGPYQRAAQKLAKDAAVLASRIVLPEPTHERSVGTRMIADPNDSAVGRVSAGFAAFVEEVQAIGDRNLGWLLECGERAQQPMHGRADLFRVHRDCSIRWMMPTNIVRCWIE